MPDRTCETCQHWTEKDPSRGGGECRKITYSIAPGRAFIHPFNPDEYRLLTFSDFGCTLHAPAPETEENQP